jgi:hypothetical protein
VARMEIAAWRAARLGGEGGSVEVDEQLDRPGIVGLHPASEAERLDLVLCPEPALKAALKAVLIDPGGLPSAAALSIDAAWPSHSPMT